MCYVRGTKDCCARGSRDGDSPRRCQNGAQGMGAGGQAASAGVMVMTQPGLSFSI